MTPSPGFGLYVHVPFCRTKCTWCAFASEVGSARSEPWLERVLVSLAEGKQDAAFTSAYVGGGTPSLLSAGQLDRLLQALGRRLLPGAELTVEANPESLTAEHLEVLVRRGGTRLSLGVQTFNDELLADHGRPTRVIHLEAAQRLLADWPGQVSLDLICGLPGQTAEGQRRDLERALAWNPDHVSWYSLTVEPETPLGRRAAAGTAAFPSDDEAAAWWFEGRDKLEEAGLIQYEVSNFARSGAQCVHNGLYWSLGHWWGLGPSAASRLPGPAGVEYRTEPADVRDWLDGVPPEVEHPSPLEEAKNTLLAGLRTVSGVPARPWVGLLPVTLGVWAERTRVDKGRLFLTRQAFPYLDAFLRQAFAELDERPEFL